MRSPLVLPCDLLAAQAASVLWRKWGFQGVQSVPEEPPAPGQVFLPKKCVTWANLLKNDPGALMDVCRAFDMSRSSASAMAGGWWLMPLVYATETERWSTEHTGVPAETRPNPLDHAPPAAFLYL